MQRSILDYYAIFVQFLLIILFENNISFYLSLC